MEVIDNITEDINHTSITNFWDRVRHMVVDMIIIVTLTVLLLSNLPKEYLKQENENADYIIMATFFSVYFIYYLFFETLTGRTPGKFINKTEILTDNKEKPLFHQVLIRTIIRLIPFQFITMFTPYLRPLHDLAAKTWVFRK